MRRIVDVKPLYPYVLEVTFAGGRRGTVDVSGELHGEVFEPLLDRDRFMEGRFDPDLRTIVWPTGADLSPEFLADAAGATGASGTRPPGMESER